MTTVKLNDAFIESYYESFINGCRLIVGKDQDGVVWLLIDIPRVLHEDELIQGLQQHYGINWYEYSDDPAHVVGACTIRLVPQEESDEALLKETFEAFAADLRMVGSNRVVN